MGTYIDEAEIIEEVVVFLRNSDIFTIAQRSVTTTTQSGNLVAASTVSIKVATVKNIRSVVVESVTLKFGIDYLVNYNDGNNCLITFTVAQTGAYAVIYDYGTDKIFPDFPRSDLTVSSFPRIACDIVSISTEAGGYGQVNLNTITFSIIIYTLSKSELRGYTKTIRQKIIDYQTTNSFYYLKGVVKPYFQGPILMAPNINMRDKVFQKNLDFRNTLNYTERG